MVSYERLTSSFRMGSLESRPFTFLLVAWLVLNSDGIWGFVQISWHLLPDPGCRCGLCLGGRWGQVTSRENYTYSFWASKDCPTNEDILWKNPYWARIRGTFSTRWLKLAGLKSNIWKRKCPPCEYFHFYRVQGCAYYVRLKCSVFLFDEEHEALVYSPH